MRGFILLTLFILLSLSINAQVFEKFEDPASPINTTSYPTNYSGVAWVDIDNDGDLDISATNSILFRNDGNDNFVSVESVIGANQLGNLGNGVTWADFDNDGFVDCFLAGNPSTLYRNNGDWTFTQHITADMGLDSLARGWAAAWSDYNDDGYVDLFITHPAGFVGPPVPSFLFDNHGAGALYLNQDFEFSHELAPYTVATWYDYDLDGDDDLFVGSGPAGTPARDYLYRNELTETGTANLVRIDDQIIGTDLQDGQVWNWIDYDNDGDLDGMITNYGGAVNRFYENQNGEYVSVTNALTSSGQYLANSWADYDNDGDLDVILTGDTRNEFFENTGDGTFQKINDVIPSTPNATGAVWGDYDNDGDQDFFLVSATNGLYRNVTNNNNNWININLKGTASNASAIGATVRAKANINGNDTWQLRQVTAQNSFNSQNSLRVHFGLGDADQIDSLIVYWPSGQTTVQTNLAVSEFIQITEPIPENYLRAGFAAGNLFGFNTETLEVQFTDVSVSDPNNPVTSWKWDFDNDGDIDSEEQNPAYTYTGAGNYTVSLTVSNGSIEDTFTLDDYVKVTGFIPEVTAEDGLKILGSVDSDEGTVSDTFYVYNNGLASDSIYVSIDFVNVEGDSGLAVSPQKFEVAPNDSVAVIFSLFPDKISPYNRILRPAVIMQTTFTLGAPAFQRNYQVRVRQVTDIENETEIPNEFAISQNYPNPFNPSTKISYQLPEAEFTVIKVYDVLGKEVASLVNEYKAAGSHVIEFDASKLSSGLYLYKIEAGNFRQTKKMLLLK